MNRDARSGKVFASESASRHALSFADLDEYRSPGIEQGGSLGEQSTVKVEAVRTAIQGNAGLASNLRLKTIDLLRWDIRQIRDDQVHRAGHPGQQIPLDQADPSTNAVLLAVQPRDRERLRRSIGEHDPSGWQFQRHRDPQDSATGPHVDDAQRAIVARTGTDHPNFSRERQGQNHERLSVLTGNQHPRVDLKRTTVELARAQDIGEGLAVLAALDETFQPPQLIPVQCRFAVLVDPDARSIQRFLDEDARLQDRRVAAG